MKKITKKIKSYELDWYADKDLLGIFPEIKALIPVKISDLEEVIKEREVEISELLDRIREVKADDFSKWFGREIVKMEFIPKLQKYDLELSRFKRYALLLNPTNKKISNFQEKLEIARNRSIYEIVSQYAELKQSGKNYLGLCPFHNEKHASFYVYAQSGSYHCFGCQVHGDVINFIQEIQSVEFKDAVDMLQN